MRVLITGGAGFIGVNAAKRLLAQKADLVLYDNLSRPGARHNLEDLRGCGRFELVESDIRDAKSLEKCTKERGPFDLVIHLAAQVAVTRSVKNPREDYEINSLGTFNLLEALRKSRFPGLLIYSSTNKVYGRMESIGTTEHRLRHAYANHPHGLSEDSPLDFHSPYGCSKGAADQYVRDYSRIFGVSSVVFRQSCIYGPHQYGVEDQGWLAWFTIAAITGRPITIYGDGKQVRDALFVEDLVEAFVLAGARGTELAGGIYNIGGGPAYTVSLLELISLLESMLSLKLPCSFAEERPGDQKVYISDVRRAAREIGWSPKTDVESGVQRLIGWIKAQRGRFP